MRIRIVACAFAVLAAVPLLAQTATDVLIPVANPCYGRIYDAAHMAAHPDQQVQAIAVTASGQSMNADQDYDIIILLETRLREGTSPSRSAGYCAQAADGLDCRLEGDYGQLMLVPRGGQLALTPGPYGFAVEGKDGPLFVGLPGSDDLLFLLNKGECD
jgi:hypothetical protein